MAEAVQDQVQEKVQGQDQKAKKTFEIPADNQNIKATISNICSSYKEGEKPSLSVIFPSDATEPEIKKRLGEIKKFIPTGFENIITIVPVKAEKPKPKPKENTCEKIEKPINLSVDGDGSEYKRQLNDNIASLTNNPNLSFALTIFSNELTFGKAKKTITDFITRTYHEAVDDILPRLRFIAPACPGAFLFTTRSDGKIGIFVEDGYSSKAPSAKIIFEGSLVDYLERLAIYKIKSSMGAENNTPPPKIKVMVHLPTTHINNLIIEDCTELEKKYKNDLASLINLKIKELPKIIKDNLSRKVNDYVCSTLKTWECVPPLPSLGDKLTDKEKLLQCLNIVLNINQEDWDQYNQIILNAGKSLWSRLIQTSLSNLAMIAGLFKTMHNKDMDKVLGLIRTILDNTESMRQLGISKKDIHTATKQVRETENSLGQIARSKLVHAATFFAKLLKNDVTDEILCRFFTIYLKLEGIIGCQEVSTAVVGFINKNPKASEQEINAFVEGIKDKYKTSNLKECLDKMNAIKIEFIGPDADLIVASMKASQHS